MAGEFDDLVPQHSEAAAGAFDDLVPARPAEAAGAFDDLVPSLSDQNAAFEQQVPFMDRMWGNLRSGLLNLKSAFVGNAALQNADRLRQMDAGAIELPNSTMAIMGGPTPLESMYTPEQAGQITEITRGAQGALGSELANIMTQQATIPQRPATAALMDGRILEALGVDPLGVIGDLTVQSAPQMAPALAAGLINPVAGMALAGGTSFAAERGGAVGQAMQEAAPGAVTPEAGAALAQDQQLMDQARTTGNIRGGIIGPIDALSMGLASATMVPKALIKAPLKREAANVLVAQPATQAALGAGGEAGAQLATTGEIKPGEVAAEALGELGTAPVESGAFAVKRGAEALQARRVEGVTQRVEAEALRQDAERAAAGAFDDLIPAQPPQTEQTNVQPAQPGSAAGPQPPAPLAPGAASGGDPVVAGGGSPAAAEPASAAGEPAAVAAPAAPAGAVQPVEPVRGEQPQQPQALKPAARGEIVSTSAGRKIGTEFELVEIDALQAASGELQNRDRTRASSDAQIQNIAANLEPERLGSSAEADRGAPIVGPDGIIESGNGRVQALMRAYDGVPERAEAYRQFLRAQGFNPDGLKRPVLIRRRKTEMTPEERRRFVIEANTSATARLTSVEQARSDADIIDENVAQLYTGGDITQANNSEFVRGFISKLPESERGALAGPDGRLSQEGARRVQNAMLARAYGDAALLSKLTEAQDNNIRSIGGGLLDTSGVWSQLRAAVSAGRVKPEFDITEKLVEAAKIASDIRERGMKVGDYLAQIDAFNRIDPVTERLLRSFYNQPLTRAASRQGIAEALQGYVTEAEKQTTQAGLFGNELETVTPEKILDAVLAKRFDDVEPKQGMLMDRAEGDAPAEGDETDRPGKGTRVTTPGFREASLRSEMTADESSIVEAGYDPNAFRLFPETKQIQILKDLALRKFGFRDIIITGQLNKNLAIDQLLALNQNGQTMAAVLNLPTRAVSLNGELALLLQKKVGYLGMYAPKGGVRVEGKTAPEGVPTIFLPQRSNSFAHEWGHALDFLLTRKLGFDELRALSHRVRQNGLESKPGKVSEAFVRVVNAMFFDEAESALRQQAVLAAQANGTEAQQRKALEQATALARGNAKGGKRSRFFTDSADYGQAVDGAKGREYYIMPTEMFARAVEAYTAFRVTVGHGSTIGISKSDEAYRSDAEQRLAKTYPKGEDRARIFSALDDLFALLGQEAANNQQIAAEVAKPIAEYDLFKYYGEPKGPEGSLADQLRGAWLREKQAFNGQKESARRWSSGLNRKDIGRALTNAWGYMAFQMSSMHDIVQARYPNSKAIKEMGRLLYTASGQADARGATYSQAEKRQVTTFANIFSHIMQEADLLSGSNATEKNKQVIRDLLVDAPTRPTAEQVNTASELRRLLIRLHDYMTKKGMELGFAENYLPRMLRFNEIENNQGRFIDAASEVYGVVFDKEVGTDAAEIVEDPKKLEAFVQYAREHTGKQYKAELKKLAKLDPVEDLDEMIDLIGQMLPDVRSAFAGQSAEQWLGKILGSNAFDLDAHSPQSKFTKNRTLPKEADKILGDAGFYVTDLQEIFMTYITSAVRKAEYTERFGPNGEKWNELYRQAIREGVTRSDAEILKRNYMITTGLVDWNIPSPAIAISEAIRTLGTIVLLPRSVLSALPEPSLVAMTTGSVLDAHKAMFNMIRNVVKRGDAREWRELLEAIGVLQTSAHHMLYLNTVDADTSFNRLMQGVRTKFYDRIGQTAITNAQRTATAPILFHYLRKLSQQLSSGNATDVREAGARLAEYGVPPAQQTEFADWLLQVEGKPTPQDLQSSMGRLFSHVFATLSEKTIQETFKSDKPAAANIPGPGALAYGIMSYSLAFWRNVIKRNAVLTNEIRKRSGGVAATQYAALSVAPAVFQLYLYTLLFTMIREAIFNSEKWDEREKEGTLVADMAKVAATRTIPLGLADPALQAATGLKYETDLANAVVGPYRSTYLRPMQNVMQPFVRPAATTNSDEYKAAQGVYDLTLRPLIAIGLSTAPGGPIASKAYGLGLMYLTSPSARDQAAEALVGPKGTKDPVTAEQLMEKKLGKAQRRIDKLSGKDG